MTKCCFIILKYIKTQFFGKNPILKRILSMLKSTKIVQTFAGPIKGKILANPSPSVIPDWNTHLKADAV